jgi:hypothetical protein
MEQINWVFPVYVMHNTAVYLTPAGRTTYGNTISQV